MKISQNPETVQRSSIFQKIILTISQIPRNHQCPKNLQKSSKSPKGNQINQKLSNSSESVAFLATLDTMVIVRIPVKGADVVVVKIIVVVVVVVVKIVVSSIIKSIQIVKIQHRQVR